MFSPVTKTFVYVGNRDVFIVPEKDEKRFLRWFKVVHKNRTIGDTPGYADYVRTELKQPLRVGLYGHLTYNTVLDRKV